jgi:putative nucleotidyltransferase with HDIG domain
MPQAASRLLSLLEDPDADLEQIDAVLGTDPGLTGNLLRLTNSAYFGLPNRIGSVRKALTLLGLRRLKQLILASCVSAAFLRPVDGYGLPEGELWLHSVAVSVAAEELAREVGLEERGEIFTAALLHDMGKVVGGAFVARGMAEIEAVTQDGVPFEKAESRVLGMDHGEMGALLLSHWRLPEEVMDAVRWHHDPEGADPPSDTVDTVHVANVLCLMMGLGMDVGGLRHEPSPAAVQRLGLQPRQLERAASRTLQKARELSGVLGEAP